jgi:hypothetical protein
MAVEPTMSILILTNLTYMDLMSAAMFTMFVTEHVVELEIYRIRIKFDCSTLKLSLI